MATEQFANLYSTTLASAYTAGDGLIVVTSASGAPASGNFSLTITDQGTGVVKLIFRVTSVSGTTFTGASEGTDANAASGDKVYGTMLTTSAMNQVKTDILDKVYGDYALITAPTTSLFTSQLASADATAISFANDTTGGLSGVTLSANCSSNDSNIVAEVYNVPSTPYSLRMRFWPGGGFNQYAFCGGLCLTDGTQFICLGGFSRSQAPSQGPELRACRFNTTTSFNSNQLETMTWGFPGRAGLCDIKIVDDGVNRTFYVIGDGSKANKVQFYTEATNTFFTPTKVGIFVAPGHNQTPTSPTFMKVIDFTQGVN